MADHGFTRGPWSVEMPSRNSPNIWIGSAADSSIAKIEAYDHEDGGPEHLCETDYANARLIAAAPELYAALQGMVSAYGNELATCPYTRRARAALAKAAGE